MERLLKAGAKVQTHDPVAHETCHRELGDRVTYSDNPYDALNNADALVICTEWDEFRSPDFEVLRKKLSQPVIFDGRNLYGLDAIRDLGFTYYSVGRDTVQAMKLANGTTG